MKPFCFHDGFQFSKPTMLFQKKPSLNGCSFMGCIGDIYCAAYKHEVFNGLEEAKLYNCVHKCTNIVPPVLKDIY